LPIFINLKSIRLENTNFIIFLPILFQITVACYAMSLSKMVHNDLHSENVLVVPTGDHDIGGEESDKEHKESSVKIAILDYGEAACGPRQHLSNKGWFW
jgi:hypothetical protein